MPDTKHPAWNGLAELLVPKLTLSMMALLEAQQAGDKQVEDKHPTIKSRAIAALKKRRCLHYPFAKGITTTDLIAQLVQVQPMNVPAGQVFYMDYHYAEPENDLPSETPH